MIAKMGVRRVSLGLMRIMRKVSTPPPAGGPVNTSPPVITIPTRGAYPNTVVSSSTGVWTGSSITYTYQWYADGAPIVGATSSSYTLLVNDIGKSVHCAVSATNINGSASASSATFRVLWDLSALGTRLKRWYDLSHPSGATEAAGKVTQVNDLVGSRHVMQPTAAEQPVWVKHAAINHKSLSFLNTAAQWMRNDTLPTYGPITTYVRGTVFQPNWAATASSAAVIVNDVLNGESQSAANSFCLLRVSTNAQYRAIIAGLAAATYDLATDVITHHLSELRATNKASSKDGADPIVYGAAASHSSNIIGIGATRNAGGWGGARIAMEFCEDYFIEGEITTLEFQKITAYIAHKWSPVLVTALPASNPYKSSPP